MKKIQYTIYICDNEISLLDNKKNTIIHQEFESLKEEEIINYDLFCEEFNSFLNKNHIRIPLFGYNLCFIKKECINTIMLEKYKEIFSLYFKTIVIEDIKNILNTKKDICYFCITNSYIEYYYLKRNTYKFLKINVEIFNNNFEKTLEHFLLNIYKPRKLTVFGTNNTIPKYVEYINNKFKIVTKFSEFYKNFILEEYKKNN